MGRGWKFVAGGAAVANLGPSYANRAVVYSQIEWPELGNEPPRKWAYRMVSSGDQVSKCNRLLGWAEHGPESLTKLEGKTEMDIVYATELSVSVDVTEESTAALTVLRGQMHLRAAQRGLPRAEPAARAEVQGVDPRVYGLCVGGSSVRHAMQS